MSPSSARKVEPVISLTPSSDLMISSSSILNDSQVSISNSVILSFFSWRYRSVDTFYESMSSLAALDEAKQRSLPLQLHHRQKLQHTSVSHWDRWRLRRYVSSLQTVTAGLMETGWGNSTWFPHTGRRSSSTQEMWQGLVRPTNLSWFWETGNTLQKGF